MSERKIKVDTYLIKCMCDEDGCDGEVLPTGIVLTSQPPIYPHKCNKCDKDYSFGTRYPKQVLEYNKE